VLRRSTTRPWIHLLGVFRPKLQEAFRAAGIRSFDSATYFRKAWLRSDQNYLGADGKWYAALRVPPTTDARTLARLKLSGKRVATLERYEKTALAHLRAYASRRIGIETCLDSVLRYDALLERGDFTNDHLRGQYLRTLQARPWESCKCKICQSIGINALIFRGYNRNKRRGAHNTMQLFAQLGA
jgi:hypothetical protein